MLLSLRKDHKEHLNLLTQQSAQVLVDFCKLAVDYLQNGVNLNLYNTAAEKLEVTPEIIQNAVYGLVNLLLEGCKHKLNDADFRDSVLSLGFSQEHQIILSKLYDSKKNDIIELLSQSDLKTWHYYDLSWRFEVLVASRSLRKQAEPIITMDLCLENQSDTRASDSDDDKKHIKLQTDVMNLVHMVQVLEQALNESRSRHTRRIQKAFQ